MPGSTCSGLRMIPLFFPFTLHGLRCSWTYWHAAHNEGELGILFGRGIGPCRNTCLLPLCLYNLEAWTVYLIIPADLGGVGYYHEPCFYSCHSYRSCALIHQRLPPHILRFPCRLVHLCRQDSYLAKNQCLVHFTYSTVNS